MNSAPEPNLSIVLLYFMQEELQHTKRARRVPERVSYFVFQNQEQLGPLTFAQLQGFYRSGHIHDDALYIQEGAQEWRPLAEIRERLALVKKNAQESRDERGQRLRERKAQRQKVVFKQTLLILLLLLLMILAVAALFFFIGKMV